MEDLMPDAGVGDRPSDAQGLTSKTTIAAALGNESFDHWVSGIQTFRTRRNTRPYCNKRPLGLICCLLVLA
jgi:hypothetical protein